jgi:hypothetical protein
MFIQKQKILRLKVSMSNLLTMAIFYSIYHLSKNLSRLKLRKLSLFYKPIKQLATFAKTKSNKEILSNYIIFVLLLISFIYFNDIGMVNFFEDLNLVHKLYLISHSLSFYLLNGSYFLRYF